MKFRNVDYKIIGKDSGYVYEVSTVAVCYDRQVVLNGGHCMSSTRVDFRKNLIKVYRKACASARRGWEKDSQGVFPGFQKGTGIDARVIGYDSWRY